MEHWRVHIWGKVCVRIRILRFWIRSKVMRIRYTAFKCQIKTAPAEMWIEESLRKTCLLPGEVGHSYTQQHSKKLQQRTAKKYRKNNNCAAKAFCYCPAIISRRPRSQNILKERALNPEKDSRIKRPRSHVSLEKSSQNYKPLEK